MSKSTGFKILMVEDNPYFSGIMKNAISKLGHEVLIDNGKGGLDRILRSLTEQNIHILLQDIMLGEENFNGIDVLKAISKTEWRGAKIVMSAQGTIEFGEKAKKFGADNCVSKFEGMNKSVIKEIDGFIKMSAQKRKAFYLDKLCRSINEEPLEVLWKDQSDIKNDDSSSSEKLSTLIRVGDSEQLTEVEAAALKLTHTNPKLGSCISVSYGCRKKCPICASGNLIPYKGEFTAKQIVLMQEMVLRNSVFYNDDFWLFDQPFFVALMGSGDFAYNSENCLEAMEILYGTFKDRLVCNISTAFTSGISKLVGYAKNNPLITPNLQISAHGYSNEVRRLHVNSDENLLDLVLLGENYAELTDTTLTLNYGLSNKNNDPKNFSKFLNIVNPSLTRIKISSLYNLRGESGLIADNDSLISFARIGEDKGFRVEIFDEKRQVGFVNNLHCGGILHKIMKRLSEKLM